MIELSFRQPCALPAGCSLYMAPPRLLTGSWVAQPLWVASSIPPSGSGRPCPPGLLGVHAPKFQLQLLRLLRRPLLRCTPLGRHLPLAGAAPGPPSQALSPVDG